MIQDAVAKIAIGREAGIVFVVDMIAADLITALVGAFAVAAGFVVAVVGEQFVADIAISGHPHTDVVFCFFDCLFHRSKVGVVGMLIITSGKQILAKFKHWLFF